ncbi:MAG: hypothetical protein ABFD92_15710 [Planctomycetaceae bacterium]|nr:hypothetical protein [Planctomycetaceae bacterium]
MSLIRLNLAPTRKQLDQFGLAWLVFAGVWAAVAMWRWHSPAAASVLAALAVLVPAAGWLCPPIMRGAYLALTLAAYPIGVAVSTAVLAAVYFLVLTPIGLLMRLLGRDPMCRRFDRSAPTYWRAHAGAESGRYFRQF